jgi:predicted nucleic acid-binding protein
MIVVDTSVWIDYFNGTVNPHSEWLDREVDAGPVSLTDLSLYELLRGIRDQSEFERVHLEVTRYLVLSTGGESLAVDSAHNYRTLRAKGHAIRKTPDCIIATFCIREGHSLLHRDRDFDPFERHLGLHVIHPAGKHDSRRHLQ